MQAFQIHALEYASHFFCPTLDSSRTREGHEAHDDINETKVLIFTIIIIMALLLF
jgi:hypothetical protein